MNIPNLFLLVEAPFFFVATIYAARVAKLTRGGQFGKGMNLIAWGMVLMMAGHIHMIVMGVIGFNAFFYLFGQVWGTIALGIFLTVVWVLFILGFRNFLAK